MFLKEKEQTLQVFISLVERLSILQNFDIYRNFFFVFLHLEKLRQMKSLFYPNVSSFSLFFLLLSVVALWELGEEDYISL
jgi:hypothetical protein